MPWLGSTKLELSTSVTSAQAGSVKLYKDTFCKLYKDEQEINFNFHNFVLFRFVFSFDGTTQIRFDGKGKRLLCKQFSKAPIVYDVPSEQQQQRSPGYVSVTDEVELTAPGYSAIGGFSNFCFAGVDDELVIASSSDHSLFIWSLSEGRGDQIIDQSLLSLTGRLKEINTVRYSKPNSTLASGDEHGIIKF